MEESQTNSLKDPNLTLITFAKIAQECFKFAWLFNSDHNYTYKSLLSGKYYRLLPDGASYNILKRNINLDCVISDIHCLPDEESILTV